jgi:arginine-tRNA-protein transferase
MHMANDSADSPVQPPWFQFQEPPHPCTYLPEQLAALNYRWYPALSPAELEELIRRGWRRFTNYVFRPGCPGCAACLTLRVPVATFRPSKSQRRVLKRNETVQVVLQPPQVTRAHFELYNRWHADREEARGWSSQFMDAERYQEHFLSGDFPSLQEMSYFRDGELVGVGLIELLPRSISSVYFYFDPEWSAESPGTFSALCELQLAQSLGLDYVYFGYWVARCPSLAYKNRFRPYEILQGYPADRDEPVWLLVNNPETAAD